VADAFDLDAGATDTFGLIDGVRQFDVFAFWQCRGNGGRHQRGQPEHRHGYETAEVLGLRGKTFFHSPAAIKRTPRHDSFGVSQNTYQQRGLWRQYRPNPTEHGTHGHHRGSQLGGEYLGGQYVNDGKRDRYEKFTEQKHAQLDDG